MAKGEFTFEIKKNIGVIATDKRGWQLELNIVSWNNGKAKWDLRKWSPDHLQPGKAAPLTGEELAILKEILEEVDPYEVDAF